MSDDTRILPHDLEAERLVLGSCLLNSKAIHTAIDLLKPEDFYLEAHRVIFRAMAALCSEVTPIDFWILKAELQRRGELEAIGGVVFLSGIVDGIPDCANVKHYAKIARERSISRALIHMGNRLMAQASEGEEPPRVILEKVQAEMLALYGREQDAGLKPISQIVSLGYKELECRKENRSENSVPTRLADIDRFSGGLRRENLIILAARPSQGKSALAVNIAVNAASAARKVIIFSLEMGQTEIYNRMIASESGLSCFYLTSGFISKSDWPKINVSSGKLSSYPIWIDDSGSLTMLQLRARATRQKAQSGLDLIVVDYLQLIQGPGRSIYERVTEISRGLKILAKDLKVPVLVLSQLHRLENESGEPQLSDLKESGAIEQDADVVFFLWPSENENMKHFKIAKQRNGPLARFDLGWDGSETRFHNCTYRDEQGLYQAMEEGSR